MKVHPQPHHWAPTCPYCQTTAELYTADEVYGHKYKHLFLWLCVECDAYVGCHAKGATVGKKISNGTLPLGVPAKKELRALRKRAHDAFDKLWAHTPGSIPVYESRTKAYQWMAQVLGLPKEKAHIAYLLDDDCLFLIEAATDKTTP